MFRKQKPTKKRGKEYEREGKKKPHIYTNTQEKQQSKKREPGYKGKPLGSQQQHQQQPTHTHTPTRQNKKKKKKKHFFPQHCPLSLACFFLPASPTTVRIPFWFGGLFPFQNMLSILLHSSHFFLSLLLLFLSLSCGQGGIPSVELDSGKGQPTEALSLVNKNKTKFSFL